MTEGRSGSTGARPLAGVRVLHLVHWGFGDALGRNLVLPLLRSLSAHGAEIVVVTVEKDLERAQRDDELRAQLDDAGITWIPVQYHQLPLGLGLLIDLCSISVAGLRASVTTRTDLIHGRTFLGGLAGMIVATLSRRPLLFHAEGFWAEERVDAGAWPPGSFFARVVAWLEGRVFARSRAAAVLSRSAARRVVETYANLEEGDVIVVPSAPDPETFRPEVPTRRGDTDVLRLVYAGSLGGRYPLEPMLQFADALVDVAGEVELVLLVRDIGGDVEHAVRRRDRRFALDLRSVGPAEVADELARCHAGLHFLSDGPSARFGSPTKVGEYWATGLPVVSTPGAGDVDHGVEEYGAGLIVRSTDLGSLREAAEGLLRLVDGPDLADRCQRAARDCYGLEDAVRRIEAQYLRLAGDG